MTEEEARRLRQENADLKEEVARKDRRIEKLEGRLLSALLRIEELERRLVKDSHNSHKPPSSDGLKHHLRSKSKKSKSSGGQPGVKRVKESRMAAIWMRASLLDGKPS